MFQKIKNFFENILDIVDPRRAGPWAVKYGVTGVLLIAVCSYIFYWGIVDKYFDNMFSLLWFLNIGIHEVGHPVFSFISGGNEFWSYAGGTLAEVLVPLAAFFILVKKGKAMQADVCVLWLSFSCVSIGRYAASTALAEVTLINAGPDTVTDWEYLHEYFGTVAYDVMIGNIFYAAGAFLCALALYCFVWHFRQVFKTPLNKLYENQ